MKTCVNLYRVISFANPIEIRYCLFKEKKKHKKPLDSDAEFTLRVTSHFCKIFRQIRRKINDDEACVL